MRIVVAFGGNMILQKGEKGTFESQYSRIQSSVKILDNFIQNGHEVVVTHGNGPQVGYLLIQQKAGKDAVPPQPLSILDAMTQGQIGIMIETALRNMLRVNKIEREVIVIPSLVVVDEKDPAFQNPTKPIGPFYTKEEAEELMKKGEGPFVEEKGKGWRKVVASPKPIRVVEASLIESIIKNKGITIAVGGGGVPVIEKNGMFVLVDAVIDKDRASQVLANQIGAEELLILTDVPNAYINYKTDKQQALGIITADEAEKYLKNGEFGKGNMGPKIEACIAFVRNGGEKGIITNPSNAYEAIHGNAGTIIIP